MTKSEARVYFKERRRSLDFKDRSRMEDELVAKTVDLPLIKQAKWIFPFVSCGTEANTHQLIRQLLLAGKSIAVPRVIGEEMEFVAIDSFDSLKPGAMGILEPTSDCIVTAADGVMLMPGLGFDLSGMRVGYGAGYYDKYLAKNSRQSLYCLGYGFDFQLLNHIDGETHDQFLDGIITEKRFVTCEKIEIS